MNNDGVLDGADIDPFFVALSSADDYKAAFPGLDSSRIWKGDCDCSGVFDSTDIDAFFTCLSCGDCDPDTCSCGGGLGKTPEHVAWLIDTHVRTTFLAQVVEILRHYVRGETDTQRRDFWTQVVDILTRG